MKQIKLYILILATMFTVTSCLDKFPEDAVSVDNAITNVDEADQAVMGIYSAFLSPALYSGYLTLLPDIQADLAYAVNGYSNVYGNVWRWEILATNSEIEAVYGALYDVIGRCNFLLDNAEKLRTKLTDDNALDRLDQYCGEAYFARALAYSELVKMFCKSYESDDEAKNELGVVLTTRYYEKPVIKRASLYDSYKLVIDDLERAAELLAIGDDYDPSLDGPLYNSTFFRE